jgi:hypothetical protein
MLFLREAVINHTDGELAVLAGQDANTHDPLASRPQAKMRQAVLRQILPTNPDRRARKIPCASKTVFAMAQDKTPAGMTRQGFFVRWMLRGEV